MEEEKVKLPSKKIILIVICVLFCFIIIGNNKDKITNFFENNFALIKKEEPTIEVKQTLTGLEFTISANDNYDQVTIELLIYNNEDVIISQYELTEMNLKKGNKYLITKDLSLNEWFESYKYSYSLKSFK